MSAIKINKQDFELNQVNGEIHRSTINISTKHLEYLKRNRLNLSQLIRSVVDQMIKQENEK